MHMMQDVIYENYRKGKRTIIIIDEAQIIKNTDTFEELRLFLNFQLNDKFLITLVLIGQPELLKKVAAIPQLEQRLGVKYHLSALNESETAEYIKYRLEVAGATTPIFTPEAMQSIYNYSGGIPRKINNICDNSLLVGFGQEIKEINKELADKIALDLG